MAVAYIRENLVLSGHYYWSWIHIPRKNFSREERKGLPQPTSPSEGRTRLKAEAFELLQLAASFQATSPSLF
eukprot:g45886.t1